MYLWAYILNSMLHRAVLMTYKHKTHAVDSDGKIISNADVDFYIDEVRNILCKNLVILFL